MVTWKSNVNVVKAFTVQKDKGEKLATGRKSNRQKINTFLKALKQAAVQQEVDRQVSSGRTHRRKENIRKHETPLGRKR